MLSVPVAAVTIATPQNSAIEPQGKKPKSSCGGVGLIRLHGDSSSPLVLDLADERLGAIGRGHIAESDGGTVSCQAADDGRSDPARATGDDSNTLTQLQIGRTEVSAGDGSVNVGGAAPAHEPSARALSAWVSDGLGAVVPTGSGGGGVVRRRAGK